MAGAAGIFDHHRNDSEIGGVARGRLDADFHRNAHHGIGAGLAWAEIFKTTSLEGDSGMLVFFTFMPLGAVVGGLGGALAFGVTAIRDAEIAIEKEPARRHDS